MIKRNFVIFKEILSNLPSWKFSINVSKKTVSMWVQKSLNMHLNWDISKKHFQNYENKVYRWVLWYESDRIQHLKSVNNSIQSVLNATLCYENVNHVKLCLINLDFLMICLFLWKLLEMPCPVLWGDFNLLYFIIPHSQNCAMLMVMNVIVVLE